MVSWNMWGSWVTIPMASVRLSPVSWRTSSPSTRTAPATTSYSRGTRCDMVVLPAPVGPTRATICPGSATKETPLRIIPEGSSLNGVVMAASSEAIETLDAAG